MKQTCFDRGFHVMAKPVGAACNLRCTYCFYLEKSSFLPTLTSPIMADNVLEQYIKQYIEQNKSPEISFVWQGGEPMLAGIAFYQKVVKLQNKYSNGKTITNSLQTNGTLLNPKWCIFLKKNSFFVGISLDGPASINDLHRRDIHGQSVFLKTMRGIKLLQHAGIEFNILACVTAQSCQHPLEVYQFFCDNGFNHIQFTPVVERLPSNSDIELGLQNASPSLYEENSTQVTNWSVPSGEYCTFLTAIFDQWVQHDVGKVFVMNFEGALTSWLGLDSTICIFSESCGTSSVIEKNGDIYSCDHYVYPRYLLGNIVKNSLSTLMQSQQQLSFGQKKHTSLPMKCQKCEALFACRGECPRHRFLQAENGDLGLSYLCSDYLSYFRHIHPYMKAMVQLINNNCPASDIMTLKAHPLMILPHK